MHWFIVFFPESLTAVQSAHRSRPLPGTGSLPLVFFLFLALVAEATQLAGARLTRFPPALYLARGVDIKINQPLYPKDSICLFLPYTFRMRAGWIF